MRGKQKKCRKNLERKNKKGSLRKLARKPQGNFSNRKTQLTLNLLFSLVEFGSGGRDRTYDQLINSYILVKTIASHTNLFIVYIPIVKQKIVNMVEH